MNLYAGIDKMNGKRAKPGMIWLKENCKHIKTVLCPLFRRERIQKELKQ